MNDVKRLIIVGCGVVVAVLLCLFIKNSADTAGFKTAYKYHIAITSTDKSDFNYDVDSHQGLVLTRGEFTEKSGVKFPEMKQTYTYVNKVHQHYTMHVQTYSCGTSKSPRTCTRIYYSWDVVGSEDQEASKISYFGRDYATSTFNLGSFTQNTGGFYYQGGVDRYYYETVPLSFTASFLTDTSNGNLANPFGGSVDLQTKSIDQMVNGSTGYKFWDNFGLVIGAVMALIAGGILGYNWVMADGRWSLTQ